MNWNKIMFILPVDCPAARSTYAASIRCPTPVHGRASAVAWPADCPDMGCPASTDCDTDCCSDCDTDCSRRTALAAVRTEADRWWERRSWAPRSAGCCGEANGHGRWPLHSSSPRPSLFGQWRRRVRERATRCAAQCVCVWTVVWVTGLLSDTASRSYLNGAPGDLLINVLLSCKQPKTHKWWTGGGDTISQLKSPLSNTPPETIETTRTHNVSWFSFLWLASYFTHTCHRVAEELCAVVLLYSIVGES